MQKKSAAAAALFFCMGRCGNGLVVSKTKRKF